MGFRLWDPNCRVKPGCVTNLSLGRKSLAISTVSCRKRAILSWAPIGDYFLNYFYGLPSRTTSGPTSRQGFLRPVASAGKVAIVRKSGWPAGRRETMLKTIIGISICAGLCLPPISAIAQTGTV
jgi:hypothetical protein